MAVDYCGLLDETEKGLQVTANRGLGWRLHSNKRSHNQRVDFLA